MNLLFLSVVLSLRDWPTCVYRTHHVHRMRALHI